LRDTSVSLHAPRIRDASRVVSREQTRLDKDASSSFDHAWRVAHMRFIVWNADIAGDFAGSFGSSLITSPQNGSLYAEAIVVKARVCAAKAQHARKRLGSFHLKSGIFGQRFDDFVGVFGSASIPCRPNHLP